MKLDDLIQSPNIAADLKKELLSEIGQKVVREYRIDEDSRSDWKTRSQSAMDLAMQVVEPKNYPWPGASNIKYPLLTVAAIQFAARAYPAIIPPGNGVKARVLGSDNGIPLMGPQGPVMDEQGQPVWQVPPGFKQKKAGRVSKHMSYQLSEEMEEWEGETDKLLHILPIIGCCFRKTWFDPSLGRNMSQLVMPMNLVVNYSAKSLDLAPRVTQKIELYPYEVLERQRDGRFLEEELGKPEGDDEDAPHEFLEQHRLWDLDGDGYPEPYIVTVHEKTLKVLRIVPRFSENEVKRNGRGRVIRIEPVRYYTKYTFLPSPDGGFYDVGFGTLMNPLNEAVNSSLNQMLDSGHLQTAGGGFIGRGLRIRGGPIRLRPGEYRPVDSAGGNIRDNVVPFNHQGPSPVLFQLLGLMIEAAKDISSVKDIMTGDAGPANEAATRTMARIEQGMKVFTAIYKRVFRALKSEYKKIFRLNALYLDKDTYFTFLDETLNASPDDYDPSTLDVIPVADPNQVSDLQKMARAEFLKEFIADPYMNPLETRQRILQAGNFEDIDKLLVQQPPPDPKMLEAADKIEISKRNSEIEAAKVEAEIAEIESKIMLNIAKAEELEAGPQLEQYKAETQIMLERVKAKLNGQQKVQGVAGKSAN